MTGPAPVVLFSTDLVDEVEVEMKMVGRVEGLAVLSLVNWEVFSVSWLWVELVSIEGTVVVGLLAGLVTTIVADDVASRCSSVVDFVPNVELFS